MEGVKLGTRADFCTSEELIGHWQPQRCQKTLREAYGRDTSVSGLLYSAPFLSAATCNHLFMNSDFRGDSSTWSLLKQSTNEPVKNIYKLADFLADSILFNYSDMYNDSSSLMAQNQTNLGKYIGSDWQNLKPTCSWVLIVTLSPDNYSINTAYS